MQTPSQLPSADLLQPVFDDRALMAFIKTRYVPFSFVVKRVFRKLTVENATQVMSALKAPCGARSSGMGVQDLEVHFAMVSEVLHIGGARLAQRTGHRVVAEIDQADIREALNPKSRLAGRVFAATHYEKLKSQHEIFERIMRECERCTNLKDARLHVGVSDEDWPKLKAYMARFGLLRDVVFAKPILLDGALVREIELRYLGQRVDEVVPRLVRSGLSEASV
jgi:hypothetical protein